MSYTNTFRKILKESEEPEDNSRLIDDEEDDSSDDELRFRKDGGDDYWQ